MAIAIVVWRRDISVVFVQIENTVEIGVFTVKNLQFSAHDQPQLLDCFKGSILAFIRRAQPRIGISLRA